MFGVLLSGWFLGRFLIVVCLVGGIFLKFLREHPFNNTVQCLLRCGFHWWKRVKEFPSSGRAFGIISAFKTVVSFFRRRTHISTIFKMEKEILAK